MNEEIDFSDPEDLIQILEYQLVLVDTDKEKNYEEKYKLLKSLVGGTIRNIETDLN